MRGVSVSASMIMKDQIMKQECARPAILLIALHVKKTMMSSVRFVLTKQLSSRMDSANARMVREWIVMDIATLVKLEAAISARRTRLKFARNALMVQHYLKMENVCVVIATKL